MLTLEPAPPAPVQTKITGTAHVGFVKDSKSQPPNQKVKAVTASIPSLGASLNAPLNTMSEGAGDSPVKQEHLAITSSLTNHSVNLSVTVISLISVISLSQ